MTNDLISKQAAQAIKTLPKCYREYTTGNLDDAYEKGWEDALFSLNALPSIDHVKHGKWIHDDLGIHCSECWTHVEEQTNYCQNCGARMDG